MMKEEHLRKRKYKALLLFLKVIPILIALCYIINTFLWIFGIDVPMFSYVGSVSFLTLAFLYLASVVFEFCSYHRMFLHYVLADNILSILDYKFDISFGPIVYIVLIGISLLLILYLHQKERERNTKEITSRSDR